MDDKQEVVRRMAQTGAIQFGLFEDAEGRPFPYYVDMYRLLCEPYWLRFFIELIRKIVGESIKAEFQKIGGAELTGLPLAALLSQEFNKPLLILRKKDRRSGESLILGNLLPGDKVLIVDDVISTGAKASDMIDLVASEGGIPEVYLVLLDKQRGGSRKLAGRGVKLISLLRISEVAEILREMGWLDEQTFHAIITELSSDE